MDVSTFKCKKCRRVLFTSEKLSSCGKVSDGNTNVCNDAPKNMYVWFLRDDNLEGWMECQVNQGNWIKGKLFCPTCGMRLGSYDFVSGSKCVCGNVLPAIHVVKGKVDCEQKSEIEAIQAKIHLPSTNFQGGEVGPVTSNSDMTTTPIGAAQVISSSSASLIFEHDFMKNELNDVNLFTEVRDSRQNSGVLIPENSCLKEADSSVLYKEQIERNVHRSKEKQYSTRKRCKSSDRSSHPQSEPSDATSSKHSKEKSDAIEGASSDNALAIHSTLICAVCLDIFCSPFVCRPCGHIFCESCLRIIAKPNPTKTFCPLCRQPIGCCEINRDLSKQVRILFPNEYKARLKESRTSTQNLPLPWTPHYHFNNIKSLGRNLLTNRRENNLRQMWSTFCQSLPTVGILLFINVFSIVMFLLSYFGCSYIPLAVAHVSSFLWQIIATQIDPKSGQSYNLNVIHETVNVIFLLLIFVITFTIVACFRIRSAAFRDVQN